MASKIKVDELETVDGSGTIALQNQLSGMTGVSMPAHSVIQVVQGQYSTRVVSSTNTLVDTGLTADITPSATSSKILVTVSQMGLDARTNSAWMRLLTLRDATTIHVASNQLLYTANSDSDTGACTWSYLDSPSSTSALTYKTQFSAVNNSAQVAVQWSDAYSTIILMEIKG